MITAEQLKALMDWIDARVQQDNSVEDMVRIGAIRDDMYVAFGFKADKRTGDPVRTCMCWRCQQYRESIGHK